MCFSVFNVYPAYPPRHPPHSEVDETRNPYWQAIVLRLHRTLNSALQFLHYTSASSRISDLHFSSHRFSRSPHPIRRHEGCQASLVGKCGGPKSIPRLGSLHLLQSSVKKSRTSGRDNNTLEMCLPTIRPEIFHQSEPTVYRERNGEPISCTRSPEMLQLGHWVSMYPLSYTRRNYHPLCVVICDHQNCAEWNPGFPVPGLRWVTKRVNYLGNPVILLSRRLLTHAQDQEERSTEITTRVPSPPR